VQALRFAAVGACSSTCSFGTSGNCCSAAFCSIRAQPLRMSFVHSIIDRHFALVVLQRQVWLRDEQFMQCVFVPQEARVMRRRHVVAICGVHICTSVQQCCHHRRIVVVHGLEQCRCPTDCVTTIIRTAARVKSLENLPSPGGGKSSFFAASTSSAPTVLLRCRFGRAAIASSHPHARAGTRALRVANPSSETVFQSCQ
jgi:hypothetical protein